MIDREQSLGGRFMDELESKKNERVLLLQISNSADFKIRFLENTFQFQEIILPNLPDCTLRQ